MTMTKYSSLSIKKSFFAFVLITIALLGQTRDAAAQNPNHYVYKIKVDLVDDPVSFKELSGELYHIFDSQPKFNDGPDVIMIVSKVDISNARLSMKLTALGYTLLSYHKSSDHESPK